MFLHCPPDLLCCEPLFERRGACKTTDRFEPRCCVQTAGILFQNQGGRKNTFRAAQEPNRNREPEPPERFFPKPKAERSLCGLFRHLVAQCSATPATVAATPPCSATPFQTQISVRHLPGMGGGRCDTKIFRGCSATPVLHLQNALKSRKSAATRVARHV